MKSRVLWVALVMAFTVVIAYVLLFLLQLWLAGSFEEALFAAATMLFTYMDVGLIAFLLMLILFARMRRYGLGWVLLAALVCTILNAIVVLIIGAIQGGWGALTVIFAIEAGAAVLIAVLIAAPLARRIAKPTAAVAA